MTTTDAIEAAVQRLESARASGVPVAPVSEFLGETDVDAAYRTQHRLTERRVASGARIIGRKIGLTSAAVQQQIGVDRPDFGTLFDDMRYADGEAIPADRLLQPRAEAEIAFLLGADLVDATDPAAIRAAIRLQYAAIEVVDSRIADWRIRIADTIADNASSGVFVLGSHGVPLSAAEPVDTVMRMRRGGETISTGDGSACLGDPLAAVQWLAETLLEVGTPLRAGDIVLSGALGPMVPVEPGDTIVAELSPLGTVTARFARKAAT